MDFLQQSFSVHFDYKVYFTTGIFDEANEDLELFLKEKNEQQALQKILFIIDEGVLRTQVDLSMKLHSYFKNSIVSLVPEIIIIPGGEEAKNNPVHFNRIIEAIDNHQIDRHSYVAAIGGGCVLDLTGFATAIAHRGIKHIRIPTTVLSQNDSGVGVKNGINYKGKKNFIGTFAPPVAVFNDNRFLTTLNDRDWRSGISEAIKVALIKDGDFFFWIEENIEKLTGRDVRSMNYLIKRCAALHLQHIGSGDPFELGSSRPLDFGHWSAHKVEQLSAFTILHGEAVAMGIALDTLYSALSGLLERGKADRIIRLLLKAGFDISHSVLEIKNENSELLKGLREFREHLGGRLTIMLLSDIGVGEEVNHLDIALLQKAYTRCKEVNLEKNKRRVQFY